MSMKSRLVASLSSLTIMAMSPFAHAFDLVPLWESYTSSATDTFYTTDYTSHLIRVLPPGTFPGVTTYGDPVHGVAAWLPCSKNSVMGPNGESPDPNALDTNMGYSLPNPHLNGGSLNIPMNFTCGQPANAAPFYRFHGAAPFTDHFYTASVSEANTVLGNGYAFERVEGYIFTTQVSGSVPLYRLNKCFVIISGKCDLEHRYTISTDSKNIMVNSGWGYDGIAGYVFSGYPNATVKAGFNGTLNGITTTQLLPQTVAIQNVSPTTNNLSVSGTSRASKTEYGFMISNTTPRPVGADRETLTFTLNTGTLFDAASNLDHIPVILYSHHQFGSDGLSGGPYDGLGIFFSKPNWSNGAVTCGSLTSGGQIYIEEFGNQSVSCAAYLQTAMQSNHAYTITLTVRDAAIVNLQVTDQATGLLLQFASGGNLLQYTANYSCPISPAPGTLNVNKVYCNNPMAEDHFPIARTGYAFEPIFGGTTNSYSGSFSNMKVMWKDASGNVLWTSSP